MSALNRDTTEISLSTDENSSMNFETNMLFAISSSGVGVKIKIPS
jgi:hypothetical protein